MKNGRWLFIILVCLMLGLTGCGQSLKDEKVLGDVEKELTEKIGEKEVIDTIEILDKDIDEETKELAIVSLEVKSNDGTVEHVRYYNASYYCDKSEEWILDAVFEANTEKWTVEPINGVNEEIVSSSLEGESITVANEVWQIESNEIKDVVIDKQETILEEGKDEIIVELHLESEVMTATGQLTINYKFTDKWELSSISEITEFTTAMRPDVALEVTEKTLIKELFAREITLNSGTTYEQTLAMTENEISGFVINSHSTSDKGRYQTYNCSCVLNKKNATIKLDAEMIYYYIAPDGWTLQPMHIKAELADIDIIGEWKGEYNGAGDKGSVTLTINDVTSDGVIKGVYSYSPNSPSKYSQPGSYEVEGVIDKETLFMELTAGTWVKEDSSASFITKNDIRAFFDVEKAAMNGVGQNGYYFEIFK